MATETQSPGTTGNDASSGGNTLWTSTSNINTSNNNYASTTGTTGQESYYLTATNFNFTAMDNDATINSVNVRIERKRVAGSAIKDEEVCLIIGGTIQTGNNYATSTTWPTSDTYEDHTITTNLPTAAEIKASSFGVAVSVKDASAFWGVQVDHIEIVVDYTPYTQLPCTLQLLGCGT